MTELEDLKAKRAAVDQEIHREKMRKTGAGLRGHFARLATMEPEDVWAEVNEALHTASLMQPVSIRQRSGEPSAGAGGYRDEARGRRCMRRSSGGSILR